MRTRVTYDPTDFLSYIKARELLTFHRAAFFGVSRFMRADAFFRNNSLPFKHRVEFVRGKILYLIHGSRRPVDLYMIDSLRCAEAEMHPQIILREIASAAVNLIGLRHSAGNDLDAGI